MRFPDDDFSRRSGELRFASVAPKNADRGDAVTCIVLVRCGDYDMGAFAMALTAGIGRLFGMIV